MDEPRILQHLRERGLEGDRGRMRCPGHDDRTPSLSIGRGPDNRVLMWCHGGCVTEEVVTALGCNLADLFVPDEGGTRRSRRRSRTITIRTPKQPTRDNLLDLALAARENARGRLGELARQLGISKNALEGLGVGRGESAWSFPLLDAGGRVVGIRLRWPDGTKTAVRGGKNGLFIPTMLPTEFSPNDYLFVAEGESDSAAGLDLGLHVIGRAGCAQRPDLVIELIRDRDVQRVAIVADRDGPGRDGAHKLATDLALCCRDVREIVPPAPFGDLREWVRGGASRDAVLALVESADPIRVQVCADVGRRP